MTTPREPTPQDHPDPYALGYYRGLDHAAMVVDRLRERYRNPAARAALGLAADTLRGMAADWGEGCER